MNWGSIDTWYDPGAGQGLGQPAGALAIAGAEGAAPEGFEAGEMSEGTTASAAEVRAELAEAPAAVEIALWLHAVQLPRRASPRLLARLNTRR